MQKQTPVLQHWFIPSVYGWEGERVSKNSRKYISVLDSSPTREQGYKGWRPSWPSDGQAKALGRGAALWDVDSPHGTELSFGRQHRRQHHRPPRVLPQLGWHCGCNQSIHRIPNAATGPGDGEVCSPHGHSPAGAGRCCFYGTWKRGPVSWLGLPPRFPYSRWQHSNSSTGTAFSGWRVYFFYKNSLLKGNVCFSHS